MHPLVILYIVILYYVQYYLQLLPVILANGLLDFAAVGTQEST